MDDLSIHTHKKMEIIFPIVGHSFLPADRVFGRTAKEFRKRDTILEPCDYINIINENATLIEVGKECTVQDWKEAVKNVIKNTGQWHVPFMKCKRFIIKRSKLLMANVVIKGEINYKIDTGVGMPGDHYLACPFMISSYLKILTSVENEERDVAR